MADELFTEMTELQDEILSEEIETDKEQPAEESIEAPEVVGEDTIKEGQEEDVATNDTSSLLFSFASVLAEDGVLPSLDLQNTKIESVDDLAELMRDQIKSNEFADLTPLQKEALEAFRAGIPVDKFVEHKAETTELHELTPDKIEENLELRKKLIKQDFLSKGYSESKAEKFTQRSIDLGEDLSDALEALESQKQLADIKLKQEVENNRKAQAEAEKQYKEQLDKLKDTVYDEGQEIIPGIKFNKRIADQVYNSMTKIVGEINGQPVNKLMQDRAKNPVEFEHKLHYMYTLTKGFTDFSKLTNNAKSKAVKAFEEKLNLNTLNSKSSSSSDVGNPDLDFLDANL